MCTGALINMLVEFRVRDMRAEVVIDVSAVVMLGVSVNILVDLGIIVVTVAVIGFEFVVKVALAVEVLAGVIIGGGPAEVKASSLAPVMTALEFALLAPLEDSFLCCRAPFSCWLMTVLDCARALQACKPSYHE